MKDSGLIIIGNGIAGVTAARHVRKRSNMPITIISSESKHFFSRTALMYIYMGHMKYEHTKPYEDYFWEKNNIELLFDHVESIEHASKSLRLRDGGVISYDKLIIATGSKTASYGWPGMELEGVQGLYSLQDLQSMEESTKGISNAVVIGGGLIGVEMAEMLRTRGIEVDFLVRESRFWGNVLPEEEAGMVKHEMEADGVRLHFKSELESFIGDENGKLKAIKTKQGQEFNCQFAGITTGVKPNIDFLKDSGIEIEKGILVNEYLESNVKDIYAIGDCAQLRKPPSGRRPIEAVWYVGKMMGEVVAANICDSPTLYQPGVWFNSAKFFHLEYHTYGLVNAQLQSGEGSLHWMSAKKDRLIRLVYDLSQGNIIGINSMGVRLDHRTCDQWLRSKTSVEEVINQLDQADFNPEFYNIPFRQIKDQLKSNLLLNTTS